MNDHQGQLRATPNTMNSSDIPFQKVKAKAPEDETTKAYCHSSLDDNKQEPKSPQLKPPAVLSSSSVALTTPKKQSPQKQISLGPYDIICGRTSTAYQNVGNKRFRVTMSINLKRYMAAPRRTEKTMVIVSIVKMMKEDLGARFLKMTKNGYVELNEKAMREKVGHALRDLALAHQREQDERLSNSISEMMQVVQDSSSSSSESETEQDCLSLDPLPLSFFD